MSYGSWTSIDLDVERSLFEIQARKVGAHLGVLPNGTYTDPSTQAAFNGWLLAKEDVVNESGGTADVGSAIERVKGALQKIHARLFDLAPALCCDQDATLSLGDARNCVARSLHDLRRVLTSLQKNN